MSSEQQGQAQVRVGLITVMSEDNTWPESFIRKFQGNHEVAKAALSGLGFEVITTDELGRTFRQMASQAATLRARGIHVLVLYVPDWSWSSNAVVGGLNAEVPVIIWSDAHPDQNGIVGAAIIRGGLEEVGVKCRLIHGLPGDAATMHSLRRLCVGISAATRMRNIRIGVGGSGSMGMYTAHVDPSSLMSRWGIEHRRLGAGGGPATGREGSGWGCGADVFVDALGVWRRGGETRGRQGADPHVPCAEGSREGKGVRRCLREMPSRAAAMPHDFLPGDFPPERSLGPPWSEGIHRLRV